MTGKTLLTTALTLSLTAIPVVAQAAPAATTSASALSLSPTIRAGRATKGEHISRSGWIIGLGMIAIGAGAIVLAADDNNDNSDSN